MDYSESICFSAAPAEALNKKAFILNRSLFLCRRRAMMSESRRANLSTTPEEVV